MKEEVKAKISRSLKGRMPKFIPNNKGRKHTSAYAEAVRLRKLGVKANEATRKKMSETHKRLWSEGKVVRSPEAIQKIREANLGARNHGWKGGITPLRFAIRSVATYKEWRNAVFKRDGYACVLCGYKSGGTRPPDIQADHIKPFSTILQENGIKTLEDAMNCTELWLVENGRTLCIPCHKKTPTWGGNMTRENRHLVL